MFRIPEFNAQQYIIYCLPQRESQAYYQWKHEGEQLQPLHDLKCTACRRPSCDAGCALTHLSWKCWVMSSQYHLIMMSSRIRFAMGLVDGTSVWFSLVLAWGAMSWKAIRSIKRSTGMVWAAACAERQSEVARERGLERLSQLLPDGIPLWHLAHEMCPVKQCERVSECMWFYVMRTQKLASMLWS